MSRAWMFWLGWLGGTVTMAALNIAVAEWRRHHFDGNSER